MYMGLGCLLWSDLNDFHVEAMHGLKSHRVVLRNGLLGFWGD